MHTQYETAANDSYHACAVYTWFCPLCYAPLTTCLWPMSADLEHNLTNQMTALMQATVVKAVLPLWSHPQLSKCSFRITRHVITILTDCSAGTSSASAVLNRASTVIRPNAAPDPAMVQNIVDMGFSRARVEETLRRVCC